jgi:putative transposase
MLTTMAYEVWLRECGLSDPARAVIDQVRASGPARRVRSRAGNVSGRYPSRKMGATIQFESHTVELPAIHLMEHDPDVLEYFDQPPAFTLRYATARGRNLGVVHTPDFFVLRIKGAGWDECKPEEELTRLAQRMPGRYVREADGVWRCPPGEAHAEPLGLSYRVRSSSEINWVLQRNIALLQDYFALNEASIQPALVQAVCGVVHAESGIRLQDVAGRVPGVSTDDLYALIAIGVIYVDLQGAPLVEPDRVSSSGTPTPLPPIVRWRALATRHPGFLPTP